MIDGLFDGIDQELTTSMGKTVLIERLGVPDVCTVQRNADVRLADFDVDDVSNEPGRRREQDGDRGRRPFWCRPDGALRGCLTGPVPERGSSWLLICHRGRVARIGRSSSILEDEGRAATRPHPLLRMER